MARRDGLDIINMVCSKSNTLHHKNVAFMPVPQHKNTEKKNSGNSIQAENLQMKAQHNHFQQFLCLCVNMAMFLMLFYDAKQHRLWGVSNGKWKNKSEFRVLKDVESDNHTSSVSAQVYSEKL